MSELIHRTVNAETGEITERILNEKELKEYEEFNIKMIEEIKEREAKTALRKTALSKLIDLGLTEEEIAALQADG